MDQRSKREKRIRLRVQIQSVKRLFLDSSAEMENKDSSDTAFGIAIVFSGNKIRVSRSLFIHCIIFESSMKVELGHVEVVDYFLSVVPCFHLSSVFLSPYSFIHIISLSLSQWYPVNCGSIPATIASSRR